jgi:hypothetical protein
MLLIKFSELFKRSAHGWKFGNKSRAETHWQGSYILISRIVLSANPWPRKPLRASRWLFPEADSPRHVTSHKPRILSCLVTNWFLNNITLAVFFIFSVRTEHVLLCMQCSSCLSELSKSYFYLIYF